MHLKEVTIVKMICEKMMRNLLVCHLLGLGVGALFGPESGTTSGHIQSICDAFEIPHIETRWDIVSKRNGYSINLSPSPRIIGKVNIIIPCRT